MSVSGFSVAHDVEVQQYRRMRAAYMAERKGREAEVKIEQREERKVDGHERTGSKLGRLMRLKSCLKKGRASGGEEMKGGSDQVRVVDEKRQVRTEVEGDGDWSDAETEVDLIDILKDGKVEQGKAAQREKAPPYVFLQSMAGVTDPLGRRGLMR